MTRSWVCGLEPRTCAKCKTWQRGSQASGKWLVPHAENGIGPLRKELLALAKRTPGLQIYLPHLGWPRQEKIDDQEWEAAVSELHEIPGMVVGISAIAHFSREPFPHPDIETFRGAPDGDIRTGVDGSGK